MSDEPTQPEQQRIRQAAEFDAETRWRVTQLEATVERLVRELGRSGRMAAQELDSPTPRFRIFPAKKSGTSSYTEQIFVNASGGLVNLPAAQARGGTLIPPPPNEAFVLEVEDGTTKRFLSIRETGSIDPVMELDGTGLTGDVETWSRDTDYTAVGVKPLVRTYLDTDGTLYGYQRHAVYDSIGGCWTIAQESRYVICVIPTECEDAVIDITPSYDDALIAINPYTMAVVADVAYDDVEAVTNIYVDSVDAVTGVAADDLDVATNIYYGSVDVVTNVAYSNASFVTDVAYEDVQVLSDISLSINCNDDGTITAVVTPTYATVSKITSISYADASHISSISYASASQITSVTYESASHISSISYESASHISSISYANASHVTSISYANAVWSIGYTAATFVTALDLTKDGFLKCPAAPPEPPP